MRKIFLDLTSSDGLEHSKHNNIDILGNGKSTVTARLLQPALRLSLVDGVYILCQNGRPGTSNKYFSNTYYGAEKPKNWKKHK